MREASTYQPIKGSYFIVFQVGGALGGAWLGGALGRKATVLLSAGA